LTLHDLEAIKKEGKGTSVSCGFCGRNYDFSHEEVCEIAEEKLKKLMK
jgi:redox-regulated HSP33 family molecular chaperone